MTQQRDTINFKDIASMLWLCRKSRKSIWPVKKWLTRGWLGCPFGARCKWFACGPDDATAIQSSFGSLKSRLVSSFWCCLTQVFLKKRPLKGHLLFSLTSRFVVTQTWKFCQRKPVNVNISWEKWLSEYWASTGRCHSFCHVELKEQSKTWWKLYCRNYAMSLDTLNCCGCIMFTFYIT